MKNNSFKNFLKLSWLMLAAMILVTSCDPKDDDDDKDPILVEDGFYIKGALTPYEDLDFKGSFVAGVNEVGQEARTGMYEKYITLKAGAAGFNIYQVAGQSLTTWGPATVENINTEGASEQPNITIQKGTLGTSGVFTVPADGLYHVILDIQTNTFIIAPVPFWAIIGGATELGWSDTPLQMGAFSLNQVKFEKTGITLRGGEFKFRYGGGWKLEIAEEVKANTNYGGVVSGTLPNLTTTLVPGGDNYALAVAQEGVYTVSITWTADEGYKSALTRTGDAEPLPEWPEALYAVGAATAYGWDTPGDKADAIMHKLAGGGPSEGIFWKIFHIQGGEGFKIAAASWGNPNIGFGEVNAFDAEGVTVSSADGNMSVVESGVYIVVVNLRDDEIKISVKPAAVYGIGDAFGSWDSQVEANLFTVNNTEKTVVSPALPADGNIRMYAYHAWIPAWWNAEFNVFDGVIVYRNDGGDQDAVPGTAGKVITLHFDDNTGSIQ